VRDFSEEQFNQTLDLIYDAAVEAEGWPDAVRAVVEATNGMAGSLVIIDAAKQNIPASFDFGWPEGFFADYAVNHAPTDPRMISFLRQPDLEIYTDALLVSEETKRSHYVYDMGRKVAGMHHSFGARLLAQDGFHSTLIMARSKSQGEADESDVACLKSLLPHLRRSLTMARRLGEKTSLDSLDALSSGIVILDQSGHTTFVNRAIVRMAAERDGILLGKNNLVLASRDEDAAFRKLVGTLCQKRFQASALSRAALSVNRPSGKRPYSIVATPLPVAQAMFSGLSQSVLVCVSDPAATGHLTESTLAALFGLSPAESRLTINLVKYGSLQGAAIASGVTEGSARQYIKRILSKTGTIGQVDLVALVLGSVRL